MTQDELHQYLTIHRLLEHYRNTNQIDKAKELSRMIAAMSEKDADQISRQMKKSSYDLLPNEKKVETVTPTVGRIVYYKSYGTPGGEHPSVDRAAIVTQVHNATCVDLCVLNPTGMFFNTSVVQGPNGGQWDWMPYQKQQEKPETSHISFTSEGPKITRN